MHEYRFRVGDTADAYDFFVTADSEESAWELAEAQADFIFFGWTSMTLLD